MRFLPALLLISSAYSQSLLLIGLDGFRPDYLAKYSPKRIIAHRESGASAEHLIPCFPSVTFSNFYSIATGLRPEQHGIVEMVFFNAARDKKFYYRDSSTTTDGSWYGGVPIWARAKKAGLKTAAFFWPGTEAEIGGVRPDSYHAYDGKVTHEERANAVIDWFRKDGVRLGVVYFSDVDGAGHGFGPDSPEVAAAVAKVDATVGKILDALPASVNVVIVSDHGMSKVKESIDLSPLADFSGFQIANGLELVQLYSNDQNLIKRTHKLLKGKDPRWEIYRRAEVPAHLHYSNNPRIGDLVIMPTGPYMIGVNYEIPKLKGMHGYDPSANSEMNAIFQATGPAIRPGMKIPAFANTELYAWFLQLLGVETAPAGMNSGLRQILR